MTLLFFYLAFLSYLPFKGLFAFLPFYFFTFQRSFYFFTFLLFYLSKVFLTFKKLAAHGGFYSYINQ